MPLKLTTPDGDQIIHRGALPAKKRETEDAGRYLASWPLNPDDERLLVVRSYATAEECDETQTRVYLRLPPL